MDEAFQQFQDIRAKLAPGGLWYEGKEEPRFPEDAPAIQSYMGLFERIQVLVEEQIIDLDTVDRLYGSRFFYVASNPIIYHERIRKHAREWTDFIKLWRALEQSRIATHRPLPPHLPSSDDLLPEAASSI